MAKLGVPVIFTLGPRGQIITGMTIDPTSNRSVVIGNTSEQRARDQSLGRYMINYTVMN